MKISLYILAAVIPFVCDRTHAQDTPAATQAVEKAKALLSQMASTNPKLTQEEMDTKFKATFENATMSGRWCSIKDGALGDSKVDKYTINGVSKLGGDVWIINARIQFNKMDIVAPIPVQVKWAGDTPVIIVDKIPIPGSGTYSARVLVYEHTYAGTWTGGDHGGLLNGIITNESAPKPAETNKEAH